MDNQRIIYSNTDGSIAIVIPSDEVSIQDVITKTVPSDVAYQVVSAECIPSNRIFRDAWTIKGSCVEEDLYRCREIGHQIRRKKREAEFAPYDSVIAKQIPGSDFVEAETARQEIRDRYAQIQTEIDVAASPDEIKTILELI